MKRNKNFPVEAGVTYKMIMTPEQLKHLKSLVIDLMCEKVLAISKMEQEQAREKARKEISEK